MLCQRSGTSLADLSVSIINFIQAQLAQDSKEPGSLSKLTGANTLLESVNLLNI